MTIVVVAAAVGLAAVTAVLAVRRRLLIVTVVGDSMRPTYVPGDRVLVRRTGVAGLRRGDVVVVREPDRVPPSGPGRMIKRVTALPGDPYPGADLPATLPPMPVPVDSIVIRGDNSAASYDSRQLGYIPATYLIGVVTRRLTGGTAVVSSLDIARTARS